MTQANDVIAQLTHALVTYRGVDPASLPADIEAVQERFPDRDPTWVAVSYLCGRLEGVGPPR